ncbi:MAG: SYNERG-CTERM sorting domain-containing protein [Synergistaceae bacterium]|nr:SYNERG-CTERM sorting domain-containing protein [Synergistaceae bacterium]
MKIKSFRALCFVMALVFVAAFASIASATTFLGVDADGNVEKVTVNPSATDKVVYEGNTVYKSKIESGDRFFYSDGKVIATSLDQVLLFSAGEDGSVTYDKTVKTTGLGQVSKVFKFKDDILLIGGGRAINKIDKDGKFTGSADLKNISADALFAYDSKLYLIGSTDGEGSPDMAEFSKVTAKSDGTYVKLVQPMSSDRLAGRYGNVVDNNVVYVSDGWHLYTASLTKAIISSPKFSIYNDLDVDGDYEALFAMGDDGFVYGLESKDKELNFVWLKVETSTETTDDGTTTKIKNVTKSTTDRNISADVKGVVKASLDIYFDKTDSVLAVVHHGKASAFYSLSGTTLTLLESTDKFASLALVAAGEGNTETPETNTDTVVDPSTLETVSQDNLLAASKAANVTDFAKTATEAAAGTIDEETQTALVDKAGFDKGNVAGVKKYTLTEAGYLLVKCAKDAAVKVYFVKEVAPSSITVAEASSSYDAKLLDENCKELTEGTSTYVTSTEKLEAGTYTLVTVTEEKGSTDPTEPETPSSTSSSGGGCNAGFAGIAALAVLALIKKSK